MEVQDFSLMCTLCAFKKQQKTDSSQPLATLPACCPIAVCSTNLTLLTLSHCWGECFSLSAMLASTNCFQSQSSLSHCSVGPRRQGSPQHPIIEESPACNTSMEEPQAPNSNPLGAMAHSVAPQKKL